MEKLHFSILINAPKEKVWNTMLGEDTYPQWTDLFAPGSHYKGSWDKGSRIHFLAPGQNGEMDGMVSRIKENRPYEFISIEHLGMLQSGVEETDNSAVNEWSGAMENYTFKGSGNTTEVLIETDMLEEYKEMFLDVWPKALQKLKELAEK